MRVEWAAAIHCSVARFPLSYCFNVGAIQRHSDVRQNFTL